MIAHTLLWLLALELFAAVTYPIAYRAFSNFPDRGWALSKPLGLLSVGFVVWLIGLTHTVPTSRWSVLLALIIVGTLSWSVSRTRREEIVAFLKSHRGTVFTTELLFIAVFLGVALFRATVPAISATEQPMDFMFLNAAVTSRYYPPLDPWLSGFTVSYYYLGYVLIGSVALLTGIATPIAYNLGLATAAAMGGVAAFGIASNLVRLARGSEDGGIFAGFVAVFLLLMASNLVGALELVRAAGIGNAHFWSAIGVNGLTAPSGPSASWYPTDYLWWWRASRVVPPGNINEFPMFSFLVGDMHPHVMSIGFVLLAAGVAIQVYLQRGLLRFQQGIGTRLLYLLLAAAAVALLSLRFGLNLLWAFPLLAIAASTLFTQSRILVLVAVVAVGALAPLNLWDLPLGLALVGGAVLLSAARNERTFNLGSSVAISGDLAVAGAPTDSTVGTRAGYAAVYTREGEHWDKASDLYPMNPVDEGRFGAAVDVDGRFVVVGMPGTQSAMVFEIDGRTAALKTTLRPDSDAIGFGRSVAVDAETIAVGAEAAVYLYRPSGDGWAVVGQLKPAEKGASYGKCIDMRDRWLVVGSPEERAIDIYAREEDGWHLSERIVRSDRAGFGRAIAVGESDIAIGADAGATIMRRRDNGWEIASEIEPPEGAVGFGHAVAIDLRYAAVGAEGGESTSEKGAVTIFENDGRTWKVHSTLAVEDRAPDSYFGGAVAIDGNSVAVGSPGRGHGAAYFFQRELDQWNLRKKTVSRWRLASAALAMTILVASAIAVAFPFLESFDSNAHGILPLLGLITRPVHLMLLWGLQGMLILPMLVFVLPRVFTRKLWSWKGLGLVTFGAFSPIFLWLQPVWALIVFAVAIGLFALHQAGYRMPSADETVFAFNPRVTGIVGATVIIVGLLWNGVRTADRGAGGELLAVDRLLVTVPMAIVIALAAFAAWSLAHRDSEALRMTTETSVVPTHNDGMVPALGLLVVGGALVMGIELFYVVDVFGGDYRRLNTMFKLGYEAWELFAVLGGFAVWYVSGRFDRRVLRGRLGVAVWTTLLVAALGATSYYGLAAITTRSSGHGPLTLDGQAQVKKNAPAEYAAIQWIKQNTPSDAVVVESDVVPCSGNPNGCSSYTDAARISSSTGRPTIIGWQGHESQWRNASLGAMLGQRATDVRTLYETTDVGEAAKLLAQYKVSYVVVGPRELAAFGTEGVAKWAQLGTVVFHEVEGGSEETIYRIAGGAGT